MCITCIPKMLITRLYRSVGWGLIFLCTDAQYICTLIKWVIVLLDLFRVTYTGTKYWYIHACISIDSMCVYIFIYPHTWGYQFCVQVYIHIYTHTNLSRRIATRSALPLYSYVYTYAWEYLIYVCVHMYTHILICRYEKKMPQIFS